MGTLGNAYYNHAAFYLDYYRAEDMLYHAVHQFISVHFICFPLPVPSIK